MFRTNASRGEELAEQVQRAADDVEAAAQDQLDASREAAGPRLKEVARAATKSATETATHARDLTLEAGRERYEAARATAGPVLHEATEATKERLHHAREAAAPVMHDVVEKAKPKVEAAQSTLTDNVLPKVGAILASAAATLAHAGDQARGAAGPVVDQAREGAHVGSERARDALLVLRGEAVATPRSSSRNKWLIGLGLSAALLAAVVVFRKQQQHDDPWATPLTDPVAHPSLKDRAADKLEHAKEAVSEAAAGAKDKAADLAAKGQAAVADAKDRSSEDPTLAAEADLPPGVLADDELGPAAGLDTGLAAAGVGTGPGGITDDSVTPDELEAETLDEAMGEDGPPAGQRTAVPDNPGSDAIENIDRPDRPGTPNVG